MQREGTNEESVQSKGCEKITFLFFTFVDTFFFFLKILTALILGHNVSRGVRWWTDCAHSIPGNNSELKSVSRGQTSHSELGLADISEVAPQPFASTLASLHTVGHNFAASIPLGDIPLQGD